MTKAEGGKPASAELKPDTTGGRWPQHSSFHA
jgi:hypothetical protein